MEVIKLNSTFIVFKLLLFRVDFDCWVSSVFIRSIITKRWDLASADTFV